MGVGVTKPFLMVLFFVNRGDTSILLLGLVVIIDYRCYFFCSYTLEHLETVMKRMISRQVPNKMLVTANATLYSRDHKTIPAYSLGLLYLGCERQMHLRLGEFRVWGFNI